MLRPWHLALWAALAAGVCAGCQKSEQISRYTVDKLPPIDERAAAENATGPSAPREATDRTLAAIVPLGAKGWFFKLTGPKDRVEGANEAFETFLKSLKFDSDGKPHWTSPDGWQEQPGSQIRYATLVLPGEGKPLEVSVTVLPKSEGDDEQYVLVNVNRWRNQLQLPPIDAVQLSSEAKQIPLQGATATVVNLLGTASGESMGRPPFMSGARNGN
jgi:hypothetical protein